MIEVKPVMPNLPKLTPEQVRSMVEYQQRIKMETLRLDIRKYYPNTKEQKESSK